MSALSRLPVVVRSRGLKGLARLIYERLIHLSWTSLVFRDDGSAPRQASLWPAGYRFDLYDRPAAIPEESRKALAVLGAAEMVAALDPSDKLYCIWHGDEIAGYGAVFVRSPQRMILGLPGDAILIGDCFTCPAHRRRHLVAQFRAPERELAPDPSRPAGPRGAWPAAVPGSPIEAGDGSPPVESFERRVLIFLALARQPRGDRRDRERQADDCDVA